MAKNKISEFSSTPANNTDIGGIDIAEGCAPSGINNAIRELMAQLKDQQVGTDADNFTVGGNLSVTGTTTATGLITATAGVTGNVTGNVIGNVTGATTGAHNGSVGATTPSTVVATTVTSNFNYASKGSRAFALGATFNLTASNTNEGAMYLVSVSRNTGLASGSNRLAIVAYLGNGTANITDIIGNANITISVSSSTITITGVGTAAMYGSVLGLYFP
jgi:hypothetical protein